jgi:hypothetical protein
MDGMKYIRDYGLVLAGAVIAWYGLATIGAHAAGTCPKVSIGGGRANVHTEVWNAVTNKAMTIHSGRIFKSGTDLYFLLNVDLACPSQGCGTNAGTPFQDCTATQAPNNFFPWALTKETNVDTVVNTMSEGLDVKSPSGTVIMNQSVGNAPHGPSCPIASISPTTPAVLTMAVNRATGLGMKVVSVRIFRAQHGGSGPMDFYAIIGVDPSMTFTLPSPRTSDCTQNGNSWYDSYWTGDKASTGEDLVQSLEYAGVIQLNQGAQ